MERCLSPDRPQPFPIGRKAAARLDRALETALRYQAELEARQKSGPSEAAPRQQYGYSVFDLGQTHQEALATIQKKKKP